MKRLIGFVRRLFEGVLARYWSWRRPMPPIPQPGYATSPGDNLQRSMNLIMPLADTSAVSRARLVAALSSVVDDLDTGLNNVGTVHVARFDLVYGNLCMLSVYDGEFSNYIRDFIVAFGSVFDVLMGFVADPAPTPCAEHPQAFIDWVGAHDALQIPGGITALVPNTHDLLALPRDVVTIMQAHPCVQLGIYHRVPRGVGRPDPGCHGDGLVSGLDLHDLQGNILRGYRAARVRHLVLRVANAGAARAWCRTVEVTTAAPWPHGKAPPFCLNVGIPFEGLVALGVPAASLASFPQEFQDGMPSRNVKLGDVGPSDPTHWVGHFADPKAFHLVVTITADDEQQIDPSPARSWGRTAARSPSCRPTTAPSSRARSSTSATGTASRSPGSRASTALPTTSPSPPSAWLSSAIRPPSRASASRCRSPRRSA